VLVFAALTLALVPTVRKELQRARAKVRSAPVSEPPST
jgi:hypothetical protein